MADVSPLDSYNSDFADKREHGATKTESVNHPAHYGGENNPFETLKVIKAWGLGFSLGNAVKYLSRAGKKAASSELEDLKKAAWYINDRIAELESEQN